MRVDVGVVEGVGEELGVGDREGLAREDSALLVGGCRRAEPVRCLEDELQSNLHVARFAEAKARRVAAVATLAVILGVWIFSRNFEL